MQTPGKIEETPAMHSGIKVQTLSLWILSILLSSVISWNMGKMRSEEIHATSKNPEVESDLGANAHPESPSKNASNGSGRLSEKPNSIPILDQLETIAYTKPELMRKFHITLFDEDLNPNFDNWKLLDIDEEAAASLAGDLKALFHDIRKDELGNFSIISQTDDEIRISIPKMNPDAAALRVTQIQNSFSRMLGPEMTQGMTDVFLNNNLSISGGLLGRERIVTISTASENAVENLGRKYEIRTQVLYEGTNLSNALDNIDNYSQDCGVELVEDIPERWSHLFGKSD
jgi:hypothetical protein